jgi:hypothetical protein
VALRAVVFRPAAFRAVFFRPVVLRPAAFRAVVFFRAVVLRPAALRAVAFFRPAAARLRPAAFFFGAGVAAGGVGTPGCGAGHIAPGSCCP